MYQSDQVATGIWQGAAPPTGPELYRLGFGMVVLCAMEYQPGPAQTAFPGVEVVYAPNDDTFGGVTQEQLAGALKAARQVKQAVLAGKRVLVTCRMGKNRSGLVSALAMHMLTGMPGLSCIRQIQNKRKGAMRNPAFNEAVGRLPLVEQLVV